MKIAKYGGIALAGLGVWYILRKKGAVNSLRYNIVSVVPTFSGAAGKLTISIRVDNPTLEEIPVDAIAGGLTLGDLFLGTAAVTVPTGIPAGGSVVIPVELTLGAVDVFRIVFSYLTTKGISKPDLIYNGNISIKGINFPFNLVYKIPQL